MTMFGTFGYEAYTTGAVETAYRRTAATGCVVRRTTPRRFGMRAWRARRRTG